MSRARILEEIQRRSLSFLTFFSALLVAIAILFSSFKSRETACQERAHDLWFPILLQPSVSQQDLFDAILGSLGRRQLNVRLRVRNETNHAGFVSQLDTKDRVIAAQSLRFFQQVTSTEAVLHLREYSSGMCTSSPFQMEEALETNYNVDLETYLQTTMGTRDSIGQPLFIRQSTIRTSVNGAVDTYDSFQSRFPAFRSVSSTDASTDVALQGPRLKFRTYCASPIVAPWGDSSVMLLVEGWWNTDGQLQFWKLVLKSSKISEMGLFKAAYEGFSTDLHAMILKDSKMFDMFAQF